MNCDDYLSMLATVPVEELGYGRAREHAAGCRDCDRVTRVVAERERNMLTAFGSLHSSVPSTQTATNAVLISRRRKVALYNRIGLGLLAAATIVYLVLLRAVPAPFPPLVEGGAFHLQCLSPEQAAELIRPHLHGSSHILIHPNSPLGIITVETSGGEMEAVRSVLARYDSPAQSQCAVQVTVPTVPTPVIPLAPLPAIAPAP